MTVYPIENYYVGKLNFGHKMENISEDKQLTPEDERINNIKYWTIANGAVDLDEKTFQDATDPPKGLIYDRVYTLFYRSNGDSYMCLHNGATYKTSGDTHCSELYPLRKCLPQVSSYFDTTGEIDISVKQAQWMFKALFGQNNRNIYNEDKYPLDDFYLADFKLCAGVDQEDRNLPQRLMLNAKGIYAERGTFRLDPVTGKRIFYNHYPVIMLWMNELRYYNINDHRMDGVYQLEGDGTRLEMTDTLRNSELYHQMPWTTNVGIQRVLKSQRRYNMKKLKEKLKEEA